MTARRPTEQRIHCYNEVMSGADVKEQAEPMDVLLIGSGVIGSIYGGQVSLAGHRLWVLAYGDRERELAKQGIRLHNIDTGITETAEVAVAQTAGDQEYDLVIVAVQAAQLASTFPALRALRGDPHIVFFGNNPEGHAAIPSDIPGSVELAFPGVGGGIKDGVVEYVQVTQQPTALESSTAPAGKALQAALQARGFPIQQITHMDGWLKYHAVLISCISTALLKTNVDTQRLGNDPKLLRHMCLAIEEGFTSLKAQHVQGLPRNLALLHNPLLRFIAVRYWGGIMRSPKGELYFGAHTRHAPEEARTLARWVLQNVVRDSGGMNHVRSLLS